MLPPELVELIADQLDIRSVCALSQSSKSWSRVLSDSVFRSKLQEVCPWFEPQFSHRNTWRECAIEYCRRRQVGSKFARPIRKVDAEEFGRSLTIVTRPELVDSLKLEADGKVFTSKYGIRLDLSAYSLMANHLSIHKLVSFPHVVVFIFMLEGAECHVLIKYKGSKGTHPDIRRVIQASEDIYCHVLGRHVFLGFSEDPYFDNDQPGIMYVNNGAILMKQGHAPRFQFTCYDGLLLFFDEESYTSVRISLESITDHEPVMEEFISGYQFGYPSYKAGAHEHGYYSIEDNFGKLFLVDDSRGMMVCAAEVDCGRYRVISDVQRKALDEVNDSSKQQETLARFSARK